MRSRRCSGDRQSHGVRRLLIAGAKSPDVVRLIDRINREGETRKYELLAFLEIDPAVVETGFLGYRVLDEEKVRADLYDDVSVVNNVASTTRGRERVQAGLQKMGFRRFETLIDPEVNTHMVTVGAGAIILQGCQIGPLVRIGMQCVVLQGANVNHESVLEDYVFIGPNATLLGRTLMRRGAYVGGGAVVLPGVTVGAWATVGAGAVVTRDVLPGDTVAGVPAKTLADPKGAGL